MTDMIDLQRTIVADHIADLEREWDALRAERDRDRRDRATTSTPSGESAQRPPRRVRLGQWLVAVGRALAGPPAPATAFDSADQTTCDEPPSLSRAA